MSDSTAHYGASLHGDVDAVAFARASGVTSAHIVFDRRVEPRARAIAHALRGNGVRVLGRTSVAGGERSKRMNVVMRVHTDLVAAGADRATLVVAVGGGTVTDLAGFAAATYMRGVRWLPVATTVLGMVDAAIGGKTGVDLPGGKNLVGAFWQPIGVVADVAALDTLPVRERRNGMAEIVKGAIVGDPGLLGLCERFDLRAAASDWIPLLRRAARVKQRIVERDPRDTGARATLNLGHTFGHALEFASGYRLSHGAAVAVGLRAAGLLALQRDMWSRQAHARMLGALSHAGFALHVSGVLTADVLEGMRRDKKRTDGMHRFALPAKIGRVIAGIEVGEPQIRRVLSICRRPAGADEFTT